MNFKNLERFILESNDYTRNIEEVIITNKDDGFEATQGYNSDTKEYGLAYIDFIDPFQIDKEMLDCIALAFSSCKVSLYTNSGVDLHSSNNGLYKNIQIKKVQLKTK